MRTLSLQDAFRQGQETAREHLTAQEDYLLSAIRLLKERHLWDPRLFASTSAVATARPRPLEPPQTRARLPVS